jgi:phage protein D
MLSYSEKKDSDIVKDIAGKVGLSAVVDATKITHKDKNTDGKQSFLEFIRDMVKQNAGFEFFISEAKLYFRKAKISSGPILTLEWGKHIENFSATVNLSDMITGVKVSGFDDKKSIDVTVNAGAEQMIGSSGTLGSKAAKELGEKMESIPTNIKTEAALKERATARLEEASSKYVVASVKTVGIPEIVPGVCVKLDGLGKDFSEKYYVFKATHTINSSGYKIDFEARRNAI